MWTQLSSYLYMASLWKRYQHKQSTCLCNDAPDKFLHSCQRFGEFWIELSQSLGYMNRNEDWRELLRKLQIRLNASIMINKARNNSGISTKRAWLHSTSDNTVATAMPTMQDWLTTYFLCSPNPTCVTGSPEKNLYIVISSVFIRTISSDVAFTRSCGGNRRSCCATTDTMK